MALTINNVVEIDGASGSYTPSNVTDSVLVAIAFSEDTNDDSPITDITFGGTGLTKIAGAESHVSFSARNDTEIWYLVNPGTSSQTLSMTGGQSGRRGFFVCTLGGVDQSSPVDGSDTAGDPYDGQDGSNIDMSVTTTVADTIAISGANNENASENFTFTGATEDGDANIDGDLRGCIGHSIQSSTGTVTHNIATTSSSGRYSAVMAVFRAASGGTNNYSHTPTGGLTFAGSAAVAAGKSHLPSGGLTFGGAAAIARGKTFGPSGGVVFGGTAPASFTAGSTATHYSHTPTGGIVLGGAAPISVGKSPQPAGGLAFGGSAAISVGKSFAPAGGLTFAGAATVSASKRYSHVPSGGMSFGGSAQVSVGRAFQPSGGLNFGGAATIRVSVSCVGIGGITFSGAAPTSFTDATAPVELTKWPQGIVHPGRIINPN